jgi:AbrB family looped-hinge helix DNA binding protein
MEDMEMSKVTAKYQITIPLEVRNKLGILPGSEVEITRKGSRYILVTNPVEELKKKWRGKFKSIQKTDDYITDVRGEAN